MSSDSTRGFGPTLQNPQAPDWGNGPRETVNPEAVTAATQAIINPPGPVAQPRAVQGRRNRWLRKTKGTDRRKGMAARILRLGKRKQSKTTPGAFSHRRHWEAAEDLLCPSSGRKAN
jgi:hypothetical protein